MKEVVVQDLNRNYENDENVRNVVHTDRRFSIRAMPVKLNLDKERVRQILRPELWPNDWVLHHDNASVRKRSFSSSFWSKSRLQKSNTHSVPLI